MALVGCHSRHGAGPQRRRVRRRALCGCLLAGNSAFSDHGTRAAHAISPRRRGDGLDSGRGKHRRFRSKETQVREACGCRGECTRQRSGFWRGRSGRCCREAFRNRRCPKPAADGLTRVSFSANGTCYTGIGGNRRDDSRELSENTVDFDIVRNPCKRVGQRAVLV